MAKKGKGKVKKQKPVTRQPQGNVKIVKKKLRKKKKPQKYQVPVPTKDTAIPIQTDSDEDDDSSSGETEPEKIQKLLEPYTKDQLIDFLVGAAVSDTSLFTRLRDAADCDVSHRKIFVYGLAWDTTRETLVSAFESYGEIEDCNVVFDRVTGKAKGYGFVQFKTRREATKALKQPRKKIGNRVASCQLASIGPVAPPPIQDTGGRKIYVSNVQADVDPERLRAFFAKFGEIETGPLGFDMQTGKSRGFALFVYKKQEAARKAIQDPYKMFEGHQLHCQMAIEGKNKSGGAASVTTAVQQVQPPMMAAAQNLALFNQNPGLVYGGFLANPNAGMLAGGMINPISAGLGRGFVGSSQVGQVVGSAGGSYPLSSATMGLGGYSAPGSQGLGNLGATQSVLGVYGSSATPTQQGLQHAYPSSQIGQMPSVRAPGAGGSFSGYPTHMR
ncbi:RNA-binding protein P-like isoform X2 [Diospyros lotus]|nr:RNA-binding protein P-like isoform X2 [Diospyros lotus]